MHGPELAAPGPAGPDVVGSSILHSSRGDSLSQNALTHVIERYRAGFFAIVAILFLLHFNGQWRIGLDSANYRGLADSLANGRGYTFGDWAPKAIYPGLPLLLAGLQRLVGTSAFLPCVVINLSGALTLVVTFKLIRMHYPIWVAVCVTCGVGSNSWFLELCNELLTDVPFLLGVVTALYGWDRLRLAHSGNGRKATPLLLLFSGLALAGVMRPTFWILVLAWGIVCVWGLITGPRKFYAVCLVVMLCIWATFVALDPRSRGFHVFSGLPEEEAISTITDGVGAKRMHVVRGVEEPIPQTRRGILMAKVWYILHDQLPTAFFGQRCAPFSILASLIVLGSSLLLLRKHPLWVLLIYLTFGVTILLSAESRYYIMVLPLMLLGWLLLLEQGMRRLPTGWGIALMCSGMLLVEANNLSRIVPRIREQRSSPFLVHYHRGEWLKVIAMADAIRTHVDPPFRVLGPSGSVLSYFSGRHVYTQREVLPAKPRIREVDYPKHIEGLKIEYAVFPAQLYRDKEPLIARLMDRRILIAKRALLQIDGMVLARLEMIVPRGDWRRIDKPAPATMPVVKHPPKRRKKPATQPSTQP